MESMNPASRTPRHYNAEQIRSYRAKNRAKLAAQRKAERAQWSEERHEQERTYQRKADQKRREKHMQQKRQRFAQRDIDEWNARNRAWSAAHPEQVRARHHRRKALKRGATRSDLTAAQWEMIKQHYGYKCVYCGRKMQRLTQDHIIPLYAGGEHTLQNIVPACISCNSKKHIGPPPIPVQPLML